METIESKWIRSITARCWKGRKWRTTNKGIRLLQRDIQTQSREGTNRNICTNHLYRTTWERWTGSNEDHSRREFIRLSQRHLNRHSRLGTYQNALAISISKEKCKIHDDRHWKLLHEHTNGPFWTILNTCACTSKRFPTKQSTNTI